MLPFLKSYLLLFFLQTFCLLNYSNQQSKNCKKYICSDLPNNLCLDTNLDTNTITGKICDEEENKICPLLDFYNSGNSTCIENPNKDILKQFPGGPCKNPDECFSQNCTQNICIGKANDDFCESNDECNFNKSCYLLDGKTSKTCNDLKKNGEKCLNDYECKTSSGCFNSHCTSYFSLQNEADVSSISFRNMYSFCKSGYSYKGFCQTLINLNAKNETTDELVSCNEENKCFYKLSNSTNIITLDNVCENCSKSKDGKIYCPVFGGNKFYKRYIDYMNKTLNDPLIYGVCNTNERKGICNFHKKNKNEFKEFIQTINTYQMRQRDFQTFANSDDCILKIFNTNYNKDIDFPIDPVPTDEKKCPIFNCNETSHFKETSKICAEKIFDKEKKLLKISLFENSCRWKNELCNFDSDYNTTIGSESFCEEIKSLGKKFPGENCKKDEDCYAEEKTDIFGICANKTKICLGKNKGETCGHTSQCNKGLYCKKGELKSECETQLSVGNSCESSFDCKNNLACFNKTCGDVFYSRKVGEEINSDFDDKIPMEIYCESQLVKKSNTDKKIRCANKNHTDAKNETIEDLVKCDYNEFCNYTISDNLTTENFQENCGCGYNKNGYGYCPRGHDAGILI